MNAIILAGGMGTRLRPLSCTRPKLLFPILNVPLLDLILKRLSKNGVEEVTLAVKHMAEILTERYGNSKYGMKISYSKEKQPMLTGGAIKYAEKLIRSEEPFLALNGDVFTKINYKTFIKEHKKNNAIATIALYEVEDSSRYGAVELLEDNKVAQFIEKAPSGKTPSKLINAGIYIFDPKIFDYIPGERPVSIEREIFPTLAKEGKLFGYEFTEDWIDIGKIEDYLKANRLLFKFKNQEPMLKKDIILGRNVKMIDPYKIDSRVKIGEFSVIGPLAVIGKDVVIGDSVHIDNSVVFPNAIISDNVSIKSAVIGEGAIIGTGVKLAEGCVIGDYSRIENNLSISRNVTICPSKEVTRNVEEDRRII